ncbi:hypothetical protein ACWGKU_03635 [Kitasatospora sp. NPDC054768]
MAPVAANARRRVAAWARTSTAGVAGRDSSAVPITISTAMSSVFTMLPPA